uniref:mRNA cap 0 methyltransferase domain-containing protein n=2 Tax=Brassica oleracea TaxID=3712 RepID=A0A0D3CA14_BRAOL
MRNIKFKEFRNQFRHNGRFFLGSNKVMQVALGRSASDEIRPGIFKVSKFLLHGDAGLLVTDMPKEEVESNGSKYLILIALQNAYEDSDFSRTGSTAVELKEGPLEQFTHEMEPFLRKQGMPVRLNKDKILEEDAPFDICSCQFAMHYSWTTEARARRALANVSALLRPGGVFVGTMPDANVIIKKLRQ